jgi:hypothetical protein
MLSVMTFAAQLLLQIAAIHPPAPAADGRIGAPPERVTYRVETDCPRWGHVGLELSVTPYPRRISLDRLIGASLREEDRHFISDQLSYASAIRPSGVMCNFVGGYVVGIDMLERGMWRSRAMSINGSRVTLSP